MPKGVYLTIDDCPSGSFREKLYFLHSRAIPAVFFCRGDEIKSQWDALLRAIDLGYPIGNHAYSHRSFSCLSLAACLREVYRTHELIRQLYREAGAGHPAGLFRFPYGDKGDYQFGKAFAPFSRACMEGLRWHNRPFHLLLSCVPASLRQRYLQKLKVKGHEKRQQIQNHLHELGYRAPSFTIAYDFYSHFAKDVDWMWTLDAEEWKFRRKTGRTDGKAAFGHIAERLRKINPPLAFGPVNEDHGLPVSGSDEVLLLHDHSQTDSLFFQTIDHLLELDVTFRHPVPDLA